MLAAREKEGKTTLAKAGVAAKSAGRPFLGEATSAGMALWVGLEEHIAEIARGLVEFRADPDRVAIVTALPNSLADLEAAVRTVKPEVVVIDTLPALAAKVITESGESASWTPLMLALTDLARRSNAGFLVLHHARKSDGGYRDSTAIGANVDMILEMKTTSEDATMRKFSPRGRFPVRDFSVRYTGAGFELASGALSHETRVLFFIQANPGCGTRQVREGVGGGKDATDAALGRLLRSEAVVDQGDRDHHKYFAASALASGVAE